MSEEPELSSEGELYFAAPRTGASSAVVPYKTPVKKTAVDKTADDVASEDDDEEEDDDDNGEDDNDQDEELDKASKVNPFLSNASGKRPAPDEILPPKRQKRMKMNTRVAGGYAPTDKPINIILDEEDQLIVDMKMAGYPDADVAQRLVEKGFTRYKPETISNRVVRIKKKSQEYMEKLLDEELSDWHEGEDDLLREAVAEADKLYQRKLEKLEEQRWRWAAQELNKRAARERFSGNACRDRFLALENGTARVPPELDPDPEGRAREREQRLADFRRRKEEEAQREAAEAEERKRLRSESHSARVAARERKEAKAQLRAQKKKEEDEYRQTKANAAELLKQRKKNALDSARELRLYEERKHKVFIMVLNKLQKEGKKIEKKKARNGGVLPEDVTPDVAPRSRYLYKNTKEQLETMDLSTIEAQIEARAHEFAGIVQPVGVIKEVILPMSKPAWKPSESNNKGVVDPEVDIFAEDPRKMCTIDELWDILRQRGMLLNRMKESKPVILSRLNNEDNMSTPEQLRDLLKEHGQETSGTKDELTRRLAIADAKTSRKYQTKYMPRPLDENGNRTKVKMPVKKTTGRTNKRYNARDGPQKGGSVEVEVPEIEKKAPSKKAPVKKAAAKNAPAKTPARKTAKKTAKNAKQSKGRSQPFVPDGDETDDSESFDDIDQKGDIDEEDVKELVANFAEGFGPA